MIFNYDSNSVLGGGKFPPFYKKTRSHANKVSKTLKRPVDNLISNYSEPVGFDRGVTGASKTRTSFFSFEMTVLGWYERWENAPVDISEYSSVPKTMRRGPGSQTMTVEMPGPNGRRRNRTGGKELMQPSLDVNANGQRH